MKRIIFTIIFAINVILCFGKPIDPTAARQVAQNFLGQYSGIERNDEVQLAYTYLITSSRGETTDAFFCYNAPNKMGWVIVAADDAAHPIIGYSTTGSFSMSNPAPQFVKWMEMYRSEERDIADKKLEADQNIDAEWKMHLTNNYTHTEGAAGVNPLVLTKWNQAPYENALCPYDNTYSQRTVTGCVATAMAQIMKFWNFPTQGSGNHSYNHPKYGTLSANFGGTTYNWASMPNTISSANSAVATLMYHCGVSVDMNYGVSSQGGSGAYVISSKSAVTHCAEYAYKTYFGYATSLQGLERANYSSAAWIALLKADLDAGRPMQYAGFGQGGHTWVCDGYDNSDRFHMNWGWGGMYDGYFILTSLNPGTGGAGSGAGTYNSGQQVVLGIKPTTGGGGGGSTYDIRMYSNITINPNPIKYQTSFTVNADVANYGTNTFSGEIAAALYTSAGNFVAFVENKTGMSMAPSTHYTGGLTFSNAGLSATPGAYQVCIFFKPTGGNWMQVSDGNYASCKNVSITNTTSTSAALQLYTAITSPSSVLPSQSFLVNYDVLNVSGLSFTGYITVDLHDATGTYIKELARYTISTPLPNNYHYTNGIDFNCAALNVAPGDYQIAAWYQKTGGSWELVDAGTFTNPVSLRVVAPGLSPDSYETNNSESSPFNSSPTFTTNTLRLVTSGSNIHTGTDLDYYKVNLPLGYTYSIIARAHDEYNSGDGNTYTEDVSWSFKTNASGWSDSYDDINSTPILVGNGGWVMFVVSPYFTGTTGTYLLDFTITRTAVSSGIDDLESKALQVYPNPANTILNVNLQEESVAFQTYRLFSQTGVQVLGGRIDKSNPAFSLDISLLPVGMYYLEASNSETSIRKKVMIIR